jgi:hypothetical protein
MNPNVRQPNTIILAILLMYLPCGMHTRPVDDLVNWPMPLDPDVCPKITCKL